MRLARSCAIRAKNQSQHRPRPSLQAPRAPPQLPRLVILIQHRPPQQEHMSTQQRRLPRLRARLDQRATIVPNLWNATFSQSFCVSLSRKSTQVALYFAVAETVPPLHPPPQQPQQHPPQHQLPLALPLQHHKYAKPATVCRTIIVTSFATKGTSTRAVVARRSGYSVLHCAIAAPAAAHPSSKDLAVRARR